MLNEEYNKIAIELFGHDYSSASMTNLRKLKVERTYENRKKMKKVRQRKGFVIAKNEFNEYQVFTKEEWSQGEGRRYAEFDCCNEQECIDNINSY